MTRRPTRQRMLTHNGVTQTMTAWALEHKINPSTLCMRLKTMPLEQALTYKRTRKPVEPKPRLTKAQKALTHEQERQRLISLAVIRLADQGQPPFVALLARVDEHLAKLKLTKE